jgi:hypothetical protein
MNCFNEKNQHIGNLKVLRRFTHLDTESVVRWCPECGAVVVDREVDGRQMGCVVDMKFPGITRAVLKQRKKPQQGVYRSLWEEEWHIK